MSQPSDRPDQPPPGPATPSGRLLPPRLGRYPVTGRLGKGGIGTVLHVRDEVLGRDIAAKVLHDPSDPLVREAFLFEARVLAHLQHPGIVPVHELGTDDQGCPYFTMRVVDGESLHDRLARLARTPSGPDPLPALVDSFLAVCAAMSYAHSRGVLHLDLKPANIMIGERRTQVVDWGLAQLQGAHIEDLENLAHLPGLAPIVSHAESCGLPERTLRVMGTPAYMPPEQATGTRDRLDQRADVYSLGAILYHMLCRVPPYVGETSEEVLSKLAQGPPPKPSERNPQASVPWELEAIALRAMTAHRARRYRTVDDLIRDVERWRDGRAVGAATYGPVGRLRKVLRGHRLVFGAVIACAALVLALLVGRLQQARKTGDAAARQLADTRAKLADAARKQAAVQARLEAANRRLAQQLRQRATTAQADRRLLEAALYAAASETHDTPHTAPVPPLVLDELHRDLDKHPTALALAPDGQRLAVAAGPVIVIREEGQRPRIFFHPSRDQAVRQLVFAPTKDGTPTERLAALDDSRLVVWDLVTTTPVAELPLPAPARRIAFAPGGRLLALAGADGAIHLHDGQLRRTGAPLVHHQQVMDLAFIAGGNRLASAGGDGTIRVWDPLTAQLIAELTGPAGAARSVAPSADGRWLAAGADDRTIHVWDLRTLHRVRTLTGHRRPVTDLAFTGDSQRLLSLAEGGELRLWSLADKGSLLQTVRGHDAALVGLATATTRAPGGSKLLGMATTSSDGTTRQWALLSNETRPHRTYTVAQAERISGLRLRDGAPTPIAPADFAELRQHVQLVTE